jgi:hypothetical protein
VVAKMSATSPACAPADSARTDASIEKPAKLPRVSREYEGLDILKVGLHDYPDHDEQMQGAARLHEQIA